MTARCCETRSRLLQRRRSRLTGNSTLALVLQCTGLASRWLWSQSMDLLAPCCRPLHCKISKARSPFAVKTSLRDVTLGYALFTGRPKLSNFSIFSGFLVWLKSTSCTARTRKLKVRVAGPRCFYNLDDISVWIASFFAFLCINLSAFVLSGTVIQAVFRFLNINFR